MHLLSAAPGASARSPKAFLDLEQMRACAAADRVGVHTLSESAGKADLVLFVETSWGAGNYFGDVRRHAVLREYRAKSYLFCSADKVVPMIPGVFTSIERRWAWEPWARSAGYLGVRERGPLRHRPERTPTRLFSFVGSGAAHPVRARILRLAHPDALVTDPAAETPATRSEGGEESGYLDRYAESIHESAFVLCPRGGGASSFRLFETMMLGRVPVIVSDDWVPPRGPEWDRISLRVLEADVEAIPGLLEARAPQAATMGAAAREAWVEWFSNDVAFHRTVESLLELGRAAPARAGVRRFAPYLQMARPYHAARAAAKRLGHHR